MEKGVWEEGTNRLIICLGTNFFFCIHGEIISAWSSNNTGCLIPEPYTQSLTIPPKSLKASKPEKHHAIGPDARSLGFW
jgi:hypothetical protein